jgi:DNA-binding CsgD family transcriptional regulator
LLLKAARQLEPFDVEFARETYLTAWAAAGFAGSLASRDVLLDICRAIQALPPTPGDPRPLDLLVDGLALLITGGHAAAAATLQRAAKVLTGIPIEDVLRWGWVAYSASAAVWDAKGMHAISARQAQLARLARDGRTNPEIGAQLFLSARTVEWHLRRIFTKLGIGSRRELEVALAHRGQDGQPA